MKCPKCGYTRKMGEIAPDWQCPSCGIAYAKAGTSTATPRMTAGESAGGGGGLAKFLFVAALVVGAWIALPGLRPQSDMALPADVSGASVVMYSLTTCPYCNQKRKQLRARGIPFTEYFVDREPARQQELFRKLEAAGYRGGAIGTPILEVNGKMLPNNPSMDTIISNL